MYDLNLSKVIFDQLMNGRIINKTTLNNASEFILNPLFTEMIRNLDDYRQQYSMSGLELVETDNFFYVREPGANQESLKTDITMKACILLILIGKYLTENKFRLAKLTDSAAGLTEADIEAIELMPDTLELLDRSGIKQDLKSAIKNILVERNILLQKTATETFLLSDAGHAFFTDIITEYTD